jgi:hypothetical protein
VWIPKTRIASTSLSQKVQVKMALTSAQIKAHALDAGVVTADQMALTAAQAAQAADDATIVAGLDPNGQATLTDDKLSVIVLKPVPGPPPTFDYEVFPLT